MPDAALTYATQHHETTLNRLLELLRIPSISANPDHAGDVQRAAEWCVDYLQTIGLDNTRLYETARHPFVYGDWLHAGEDAPTILYYGHYDVQPPDPLGEWVSPPFEPVIRDGAIYCRGAADDKGQFMSVLAGFEAYLQTSGKLPVNVKVLLDGEEEITNPSLEEFLDKHAGILTCDAVVIADQDMISADVPVITVGLRGQCYVEITLRGPTTDLHSGIFGGAVDNPAQAMARLLAQLHDSDTRRIAIPGFYDNVRELASAQKSLMRDDLYGEAELRKLTGVPVSIGEKGYSVLEQVSVRPTLDVTGMYSGYTGPGKKNVIPATATAKISMRLVPDQQPDRIAEIVEAHLRAIIPPTVTLDFEVLAKAHPVLVEHDVPVIQAAVQAYETVYGNGPVYVRSGGTLPIVWSFQQVLGVPIVMIGFGLPDDGIHAPNEKFNLQGLQRGTQTTIHYLNALPGLL